MNGVSITTRTVDGDLQVRHGSLYIPTAAEAVRQRTVQFLRMRLGESFVSPGRGIRYYQDIFNLSPALAAQYISDRLVNGIEEITRVDVREIAVNTSTRRSRLSLACSTIYGTFVVEQEI